jgi:uncharacterized membrane protein YGL010W
MMGGKTSQQWVAEYAESHRHPANRLCHTIGIPMIALSVILAIASPFVAGLWKSALALFVLGWIIQFVGHWYEKKPPEFLRDWRFLFVGLRWWFMKLRGQA